MTSEELCDIIGEVKKVSLLGTMLLGGLLLSSSAQAVLFQNLSYSGYVDVTDQDQNTSQYRSNNQNGTVNSNLQQNLSEWSGAFGSSMAISNGESTTGNVNVIDNGTSGSYAFSASLSSNLFCGAPGSPTMAASYSLSASSFTFTFAGTNTVDFSVLGNIAGSVGANADGNYSINLTSGSNNLYSDYQTLQNGMVSETTSKSLTLGPGTYTLTTHVEAQNFYLATETATTSSLGTTYANLNYGFSVTPAPEPFTLAVSGFGLIAVVRKRRLRQ